MPNRHPYNVTSMLFSLILLAPLSAWADSEADLAKQLANPIAALISVPFQYNHDSHIGSAQGERSVLNIQPVAPFELSQDWNLISRTILPLVDQQNVAGNSGRQSGVGDVVQSLFFSPKQATSNGVIWGAGPVFLLPTASDAQLGNEQWGLGPTAVALVQKGAWTYGALANHIWSIANNTQRPDVNTTFIQPFLAYITESKTTYSINTESTYDWQAKQWSVPLNFGVSQLFKVGKTPMSLGLMARYWAQSPDTGAQNWGVRLVYTLLFPK